MDFERAPSTIPPRPLPLDCDLAPLEWWLDAHMNVASNLLCLEQSLAGGGRARGDNLALVAAFLPKLAELRDASYELYCDCGDPRLSEQHRPGRPVVVYVSGLYALFDSVLEALAGSFGAASRDDVARAAAAIHASCRAFVQATSELPDEVHAALAIGSEPARAGDPLARMVERLREVVRAAEDLAQLARVESERFTPG